MILSGTFLPVFLKDSAQKRIFVKDTLLLQISLSFLRRDKKQPLAQAYEVEHIIEINLDVYRFIPNR
jgi:hypothetical protein